MQFYIFRIVLIWFERAWYCRRLEWRSSSPCSQYVLCQIEFVKSRYKIKEKNDSIYRCICRNTFGIKHNNLVTSILNIGITRKRPAGTGYCFVSLVLYFLRANENMCGRVDSLGPVWLFQSPQVKVEGSDSFKTCYNQIWSFSTHNQVNKLQYHFV